MEYTNSIDNQEKISQLSMIGKVFKYEFISTARVFLPIYSIILALSLAAGILFFSKDYFQNFDGDRLVIIYFIIYPIISILSIASGIITLLQLGRRFKKSMLGNEAYLNLTLPVALWAHLLARILSAFVWLLIFAGVLAASIFLCFIKLFDLIKDDFYEFCEGIQTHTNLTFSDLCLLYVIAVILSIFFIATFIYMVYSIGHMAKKHRSIIQFFVAVVGLSIFNTIQGQFYSGLILNDIQENTAALDSPVLLTELIMKFFFTSVGCSIFFSILCAGITYLILRNKLNLE